MKESQCKKILEALRYSPRTASHFIFDLKIFNYTARVSDLRGRGIDIECQPSKYIKGRTWYILNTPVQLIDFEKAQLIKKAA